ncbi:MAG: hypothetical protein AAF266_07795 [Planctomycetota bacterium]
MIPPLMNQLLAPTRYAAIALAAAVSLSTGVAQATPGFGVNSLEHRLDYPFAPGIVTDNTDVGTFTSNPVVVDNFPASLSVSNTGLTGFTAGAATNRHFFFFATDDGTGPIARPFMEQEAWEMSVDVTIATTRPDIRKSAGFGFEYFINPPDQDRRNPQFVAHSNQDGQGQLADPPGKIAAFSGVFGNNPFALDYDAGTDLASSDTVNLKIVYTPPERDEAEEIITPADFEFTVDILNDGIDPIVTNNFASEGAVVQGLPDGSLLGVRVQPWGNIDGGMANGGAGDDYTVLFENFTLVDLSVPSSLPGDANGDGSVDLLDLDILGSNFGTTPATFASGDFNGDNVVDLLDLDILGSNFGTSNAASAIPEASSGLLSILTLAFAVRRRWAYKETGTGIWFRSFEGNRGGSGEPLANFTPTQSIVVAYSGNYQLRFVAGREVNHVSREYFVSLGSDGTGGIATIDLNAASIPDGKRRRGRLRQPGWHALHAFAVRRYRG